MLCNKISATHKLYPDCGIRASAAIMLNNSSQHIAIRHQTFTWSNVDPDLQHYMGSLGHNELMKWVMIISKFCTEHDSDTSMLCAKFPNDCMPITDVKDEWDVTRFEFKMSFGRISPAPKGFYSLSDKTSYRQTSWSLEAARLGIIMIVPLWDLTGFLAALLPRCLLNFKAIRKV